MSPPHWHAPTLRLIWPLPRLASFAPPVSFATDLTSPRLHPRPRPPPPRRPPPPHRPPPARGRAPCEWRFPRGFGAAGTVKAGASWSSSRRNLGHQYRDFIQIVKGFVQRAPSDLSLSRPWALGP